ncbi:MAG: ABC transporter substrate-binding protein [Spirochaetaceae bacterium]|jgi:peptide/nickel transport system substrate-binding protein|nr:ABC transporter substrate-binding protein [Spirochaetaceae bacterium]
MTVMTVMKKNRVLRLCLAAALALGGCAKTDTAPDLKEIRFGIATEPRTLDPLSPSNTADGRSILFNVFEGLVKPAPDGSLVPAVAQSFTVSEEGLVYEFTLRAGLTFHDGSPVTPEDAVFSLQTAADAQFNGLNRIALVETTPQKTVRVTLKEPDREFLPYLTVGITPRGNADREKNPVGTGPFMIAAYETQRSLVLRKNPRYRQEGLPYLDKVTYVFMPDSDAQLLALQGGSIDSAAITGSLVEQLDRTAFDTPSHHSGAVQLVALNNREPPLNDLRVRQAISYGVDTKEIIDAAFYGRGEPSGSPLIPGLREYYEPGLGYPTDRGKARALLAEAGYADGFPLEITLASNYRMHINTGEVLINQLAELGIAATIKLVDWGTWLSEVYYGRNYQATIISLDAPAVSPRAFLERYRSGAESNFINFESPRFDGIYRAVLEEAGEDRRIALYKQAQRVLVEEAASVYIQDIEEFVPFPKGKFSGLADYPLYVVDFSTVRRN